MKPLSGKNILTPNPAACVLAACFALQWVTPHDEDDSVGSTEPEAIDEQDVKRFQFWAPAHVITTFSIGTASALRTFFTLALNMGRSDGKYCNFHNRLNRFQRTPHQHTITPRSTRFLTSLLRALATLCRVPSYSAVSCPLVDGLPPCHRIIFDGVVGQFVPVTVYSEPDSPIELVSNLKETPRYVGVAAGPRVCNPCAADARNGC